MSEQIKEKYYNKEKSVKQYLEILTSSAVFWSWNNLAKSNKVIQDTMLSIFKEDQKIFQIVNEEQIFFSNYITMVIVSSIPNRLTKEISNFLDDYETLKPRVILKTNK